MPSRLFFAALVSATMLSASLSACGGGDGDRQAKIDLLISEGETQQTAECYVDELPGYDLADFENLISADSIEEADEEFFDAALDASGVCE